MASEPVEACDGVDLLIHETFSPMSGPLDPPEWWADALIAD